MVGVPRSTGCQLCVRRKVKCDEARPACAACTKYGAECPGYDRIRKFVFSKHQKPHRGKPAYSSAVSTYSSSNPDVHDAQQLVIAVAAAAPPRPAPPRVSLWVPRGTLLHTMIEQFNIDSAPPDVVGLFEWVGHHRLGKLALLDGAISSFALHLAGKEKSDLTLIAHSRAVYGLSLGQLQATLAHSSRWKSSETLCSAILLCYFELFAGTSAPDNWLQHCKGIGTLMEQRGPAEHAEGWDAAMLLAFRGILIMGDLFYPTEKKCFLAHPEWKHVMQDRGRCLVHPQGTPIETIQLVDGFFLRLVELPEVLKWGYLVREANRAGVSMDVKRISTLSDLAAENHASFARWYRDFTALRDIMPTETVATDPETSLYPTKLSHPYPWAGAMHLGYWASELILQETMAQCGVPVPNWETVRRSLVDSILRSVESVGQGLMGPYRVGYAVRIAYEFASPEAQHWIQDLLGHMSKSYASTDPSLYPEPASA